MRLIRDLRRSATARHSWWLRLRHPANLFQPSNDTDYDRYPEIFAALKSHLADRPSPRILSFGCSTGEEVVTLRRYFPEADLVGVDISRSNVARARRRPEAVGDARMSFGRRGTTVAFRPSSFDAIVCLAVLRHGDLSRTGAQTCRPLIEFGAFEQTVTDFDRCLRAGGLLALEHSNFRFEDTAIAARYRCVLRLDRLPDPRSPIFDRHDRLIPSAAYPDVLFRKGPPS